MTRIAVAALVSLLGWAGKARARSSKADRRFPCRPHRAIGGGIRSRRQALARRCAVTVAAWHRAVLCRPVRDCRDMFMSHRTVNPDDVENAAWHFLCVARAESAEAAASRSCRSAPMRACPMREVYQMFLGALTPAQVLAAAGNDASAQFFARLYIGPLSRGDRRCRAGREHIAIAAAPALRARRRLHARRRASPYDGQIESRVTVQSIRMRRLDV